MTKFLSGLTALSIYAAVAYSGCEVFHLGSYIFYINVVLLVSGTLAVLFESFHLFNLEE